MLSFLIGTGFAVISAFSIFIIDSCHLRHRHILLARLVFSKVLLGVNDTQLFTGTAVQIVSLVQLCTVSVYHFRVVTELAYLSTVTHLLTVVTLRHYFAENPWVNINRVLVMVVNLVLLGYTTWIEYALDTMNNSTDGMLVACYLKELPSTTGSILRWTFLLLAASVAHVSVFWAMYVAKPAVFSRDRWSLTSTTVIILRDCIIAPAYTIYGLVVSSQVLRHTQAFGSAPISIIGSEREWGFGQVLAVFLLALVILPGWEAFSE